VLVRHGSERRNLKNLFTGLEGSRFTEKGVAEPSMAGGKLKAQGLSFNHRGLHRCCCGQHTLESDA